MLLKTRTADAAIGRWPGILQALGVDAKFLSKKHGPCPMCGGKDRFRFDDKGGRGTWFCSQCGAGDGFEMLQMLFGWGFVQSAKEIDRVIGTVQSTAISKERTEAEKLATIEKVLKQSRKVVKGDPVWIYLNRRTGIETVPTDIRFHPGMKHSAGGTYPVMLAVMRDRAGKGVSAHRTYLTNDGEKAPVTPAKKFMEGRPLNGSAVRLSAVGEHLGIAEGIETALAASMRFGAPVWAATNATLMQSWSPPDGVRRVSIYADNDSTFTGQSAAYALAFRLARDGIAAEVLMPDRVDMDWCDARIERVV
jgi:putative DNA primase/helicase